MPATNRVLPPSLPSLPLSLPLPLSLSLSLSPSFLSELDVTPILFSFKMESKSEIFCDTDPV